MIRNYLLTAIRGIHRHRFYSLLNVLGLTVGLSCALLITTYVYHELQYDQFHEHKDRIVRAGVAYSMGGTVTNAAVSPTALLPTLQREFPEVVGGTRVVKASRLVQAAQQSFQEEDFFFADSTFFSVFSFRLLQGKAAKVLRAPASVVITASAATKYFGAKWSERSLIGETLLVGTERTAYQITGVMADPPVNSHVHPSMVASTTSLQWFQEEQWEPSNYYTYLLLADPGSVRSLREKIPALARRKLPYIFEAGGSVTYNLMPLTDIHLHSSSVGEAEPGGNYRYVYIFSAVALLILLVACINYVNLTTARAAHRAREVGVRKVLGAHRGQLGGQFIGEAALITTLSLLASIVLTHLLLPYLQQLAQRELTLEYLNQAPALGCILLVGVTVSLLAGGYPALVLSSFRPVQALKGKVRSVGTGGSLRQALVVVQFVVSAFLIMGTLAIYQQLRFMQQQQLGYDKSQLIALPMDKIVSENYEAIKTEMEKQSSVEAVSAAAETPTSILGGYGLTFAEASDDFMMGATGLPVHQDFAETVGLELVAGANFTQADLDAIADEDYDQRTYGFLINETAARKLGFSPAEALEKDIIMTSYNSVLRGVVKDFHFNSLHKAIEPLVIFLAPRQSNVILVRTAPNHDISTTVATLESTWSQIIQHRPFDFTFLDDELNALYVTERQAGQLFNVFSGIAVFIACLGLLGLTAFMTEQRSKEIGVRKVLGASAGSIVLLLSRDITKLVLIALVIAVPAAYVLMNHWLAGFAYRISVPIAGLALAGLMALLVAWLTVSYQSLRAAWTNPVDALRNE